MEAGAESVFLQAHDSVSSLAATLDSPITLGTLLRDFGGILNYLILLRGRSPFSAAVATITDMTVPRLSSIIRDASFLSIVGFFVFIVSVPYDATLVDHELTLLQLIVRWVARGLYRVYFHPLSRFPGPKFSAFTRIPLLKATWAGDLHRHVAKLHEDYGEVVRISPDELSFIGPTAIRDIYGHGSKGTRGSPPPKNFQKYGLAVSGKSLIQAPDADHTRMRRIFSPAFSDRALKQQEPLFRKYVDKLVASLRQSVQDDPKRPIDLVRMYNFTTFDIMGDLTFGESLHMLDNAEYDPWVKVIFDMIKIGGRFRLLSNYPSLGKFIRNHRPKMVSGKRDRHFQYCVDRVTKRLEKGRESEGVDLWSLVLSQDGKHGLTRDEMNANASTFMVAGTETTATLLSGLTYLLLKNLDPMRRLVSEVRSAFVSPAHMSLESIAALPYLNACIKEALRLYPPVATGPPRITPPDGSTICGHYVPPGVSTFTRESQPGRLTGNVDRRDGTALGHVHFSQAL
jgi:cytochrome P450